MVGAFAQVEEVSVQFESAYTETVDGSAVASNGSNVSESIFLAHADDISSATVSGPGLSGPLTLSPYSSVPTQWNAETPYSSISAMASSLNGVYTFNAAGSSFGSQTFTVNASGSLPGPTVLTGNSIEALTTDNPAGSISITLSPIEASEGSYSTPLDLYLFSGTPSTGETLLKFQYLPDPEDQISLGWTIPAGTLQANATYSLGILSHNLYDTSFAGPTYVGEADYSAFTTVSFTTTASPEPPCLSLLAISAMALLLAGSLRARVATAAADESS
jgi:hypothetical protein